MCYRCECSGWPPVTYKWIYDPSISGIHHFSSIYTYKRTLSSIHTFTLPLPSNNHTITFTPHPAQQRGNELHIASSISTSVITCNASNSISFLLQHAVLYVTGQSLIREFQGVLITISS